MEHAHARAEQVGGAGGGAGGELRYAELIRRRTENSRILFFFFRITFLNCLLLLLLLLFSMYTSIDNCLLTLGKKLTYLRNEEITLCVGRGFWKSSKELFCLLLSCGEDIDGSVQG